MAIFSKDDEDYERPEEWGDNLQVIDIRALADAIANSTATQGLDWYVVNEMRGISAKDWAYFTDRSEQTVKRNVDNYPEEQLDSPTGEPNIFESE